MRFIVSLLQFLLITSFSIAKPISGDSIAARPKYLDSLEALHRKTNLVGQDKVDLLNLLGRLYTDRDMEKAKQILHQSRVLADSINYLWGLAQAYKYLGIVHDYQGYVAVSASYFQNAITLLKQDSSQRFLAERLLISSYPAGRVILGPLTQQFVIPRDSSMAFLEKSIALKHRMNDHLGTADAYDRLAFEYWDKGYNGGTAADFSKALSLWLAAKNEYGAADNEDGVAFSIGKIGVGYEYLNNPAAALRFYHQAFSLCKGIGNRMYMARNLINIARLNTSAGRTDSAKIYLKRAVDLAEKLQVVVVTHRGYLELAKLYEADRNYKMASECYLKLFRSRDLHFSQAHLLTTVEMQAQYENQLKNNQIKQLELENQVRDDKIKKNSLVIMFLSIIIVIIAVGSYLLYSNRRKYRDKLHIIETQNRLKHEKDRISKELHDNIGTRLTTLTLSLRELERKSTISSPVMELIRNDIQTVITELRDSIWAINENEITLEELSDKVRNLFWRAQQDNPSLNCKVSLITDQPHIRLKPQVAINLFRIIQEAIANSVKHSGATEIDATLKYESTADLIMTISDNGSGFNSHHNGKSGLHFGLQNMRSRANEIGASLEIRSDNGTSISIVLRESN